MSWRRRRATPRTLFSSSATFRALSLAPLLTTFLVCCLAGSLAACAGRRPAEEAPTTKPTTKSRAPTPTPAPTLPPTPTPTPTPTPVPPAIACASGADCTLTPYPRPVTSAAGCYCPACPVARNAAVAAANEESWQRVCGVAWTERARCLAPMCRRLIAPACIGGACLPGVSGEGAPPR